MGIYDIYIGDTSTSWAFGRAKGLLMSARKCLFEEDIYISVLMLQCWGNNHIHSLTAQSPKLCSGCSHFFLHYKDC